MDNFFKKQLIAHINSRANMIIFDANTFIWIRHNCSEDLKRNTNIGGGNLLMILGLFSALNFLAKIYKILHKGNSCIVNKEEIKKLKDFIKKHSEVKKMIQPKIVGQIRDEESAFIKLIKDSESNFGLNEEKLRYIWKCFRNYLVHSATIYPGASSITFTISNKNFKQFLDHLEERKRPVFARNQYGPRCYPDILNVEVKYIKNWLIKEIESNKFSDKNVEAAFNWIQNWN
jgi:hypothetical protein